MQGHRGYTAGRFALEIDNVSAGWIFSAEGGNRIAEVVTEKLSQEHHARKHIAGLKYEEITISCGIGMSKHLWQTINASFKDGVRRFDGAIHMCDYNNNIVRTLEFYQGLVTEVGFPALDASSKDAAKFTFKIAPEMTRTRTGKGKVSIPEYPLGRGQQKRWLPSNFRLNIDGLERACAYVNKIEPITIKQKVVENTVGESRQYSREPAGLEIPNLVLTTTEANAAAFYHWENNFIIQGKCNYEMEKTGTLEYLTSDLKDTLFSIEMLGMGLFKLTPDKMEAGNDIIRRVKAEVYVEQMNVHYGDGSTWA